MTLNYLISENPMYLWKESKFFQLEIGDIFSVDKQTFKHNDFKHNNRFRTLNKPVWYKPTTWFPRYYVIMYIGEK